MVDLNETLRVYVFHPQLLYRQLFDFRFRPQTGSGLFIRNRKLKTPEPEAEKYLIQKPVDQNTKK